MFLFERYHYLFANVPMSFKIMKQSQQRSTHKYIVPYSWVYPEDLLFYLRFSISFRVFTRSSLFSAQYVQQTGRSTAKLKTNAHFRGTFLYR